MYQRRLADRSADSTFRPESPPPTREEAVGRYRVLHEDRLTLHYQASRRIYGSPYRVAIFLRRLQLIPVIGVDAR